MDERPSDEDARVNGFKDAEEWWTYSTSGALLDPYVVREITPLVAAQPEVPKSILDQQWQVVRGHLPPSGTPADDLMEFRCEGSGAGSARGSHLSGPTDRTAAVADELGIAHPYLLSDVWKSARICSRRMRKGKSKGKHTVNVVTGQPTQNEMRLFPTIDEEIAESDADEGEEMSDEER